MTARGWLGSPVSPTTSAPEAEMKRLDWKSMSVEDRFFEQIMPEPNSGCWLWTGKIDHNGYARIRQKEKRLFAHRLSHEMHKGPIPPGKIIDHLCRVRGCVNPDHLEAVTHRENKIRGDHNIGRHAKRHQKAESIDVSSLSEKQIRKMLHLLCETTRSAAEADQILSDLAGE